MTVRDFSAPLPFRIRIGVTGHRQLHDEIQLAERVQKVLAQDIEGLLKRPRTGEAPIAFTVVSPLAEGADRLVVREVFKCHDRDPRLEVVLPLPKAEYARDFESAESRQEFASMLDLARRPVSLMEISLEEIGEHKRADAYRAVGEYVVDRCDVLIALWDGQPSRGRGGTSEIIDYARSKARPTIIISTQQPYQIHVEPHGCIDASAIARLADYNKRARTETIEERAVLAAFGLEPEAGLPPEHRSFVVGNILPHYLRASARAHRNQRLYQRAGVLVYVGAVLAVAATALEVVRPDWARPGAAIELLILIGILVLVAITDRSRAHANWLEHRFLAERLRSAAFFAACGFEVSPVRVPPYTSGVADSSRWALIAFDEIWNRLPRLNRCAAEHCAALAEYVRGAWIHPQIAFHEAKQHKARRSSERLELAGKAVFALALIPTSLQLLAWHPGPYAANAATFLAIVLPAAGAALAGIRQHREYARLAARSAQMAMALHTIDRRLQGVTGPAEMETVLREAERLTVSETLDWLALMSFATVDVAA